MARRRVLLTTAELARLNNILTGKNDEDPWRHDEVTVTLPNGRTETLGILTNAVLLTREKLHHATELAEAGAVVDAAVETYVAFVLAHIFKDANRRSAVLAAHYFLERYGVPLSGVALHELGLGDLRDPAQVELLRETVTQMAKFASRRSPS